MLIKCPECGKEISDKSKTCVNCGYPIAEYVSEQEELSKQAELDAKARIYSGSYNNVYVYCGKYLKNDMYIEIKDGYMTVFLPRHEKITDVLSEFSLEYFYMPNHQNARICIYNINKGYDTGIIQIPIFDGKRNKNRNRDSFIVFKEIMDRNGLFKDREKRDVKRKKSADDMAVKTNLEENFNGVYRVSFGKKIPVFCPRCGSADCYHRKNETVIPSKTKTTYSANLNPLKPFTFANKNEKVVRQERTITTDQFVCNSCGKIFS